MVQWMDGRLFSILNRGAANPFLDWFMPRITNLHHNAWFLVLVGVALVFGLIRGSPKVRICILCALVAVGCSDGFASHMVKRMIPRDRPCFRASPWAPMHVPADRLVPGTHCPGSHSFPSNHASNTMALAAVFMRFVGSRKRWLWLLLPLLIGYSRIYLGFHYPTDVFGGWLIGGCIGWLAAEVGLRWHARLAARPQS
ncbi:MAG: phosphatase PAP2 family protein [Chthonomonadales bacterium]